MARMPSAPLWLLLLFGGAGLLASFTTLPGGSLLSGELQNTGHTLLFATLAILALQILHHKRRRHQAVASGDYLTTGLLCLLAGLGIELIQALEGRGFSSMDLARDCTGMLAGLALYAVFDSRLVRCLDSRMRRLLTGSAALLVVISLAPLALLTRASLERAYAFPVVLDLTEDWSQQFSNLQDATLTRHPGQCSHDQVRLHIGRGEYPGVIVSEPYPDWRGYRTLLIPVGPGKPAPAQLWLRVHDKHHDDSATDRFVVRLEAAAAGSLLSISLDEVQHGPAGREMDMAQIAGLALYSVDVQTPFGYCLGRIRLE